MKITAKKLQTLLLTWFDQHGRKDFPWQHDKTAYRVWVSEIMLQQTQVQTVIPYYERFLQRFPTVQVLADAEEDEVLHLWAGLGYYSRAHNLLRTAKILVENYQAKFPDTLAELQKLPGIGQSTAGAILALAFNQRATILDGNVKRVLARCCGIVTPINEKNTENQLWELAEYFTPTKRIADYTQALMDLGATCCTRSKPQCHVCPLRHYCFAYAKDMVALLPSKKIARVLPVRVTTFIILKKDQQILLAKRPPIGIWGGLWSFPELSGQPKETAIHDFCRRQLQMTTRNCTMLHSFRHTFTHFHLDIFPVIVAIKKIPTKIMESSRQIWYNLQQPAAIGLPKPVQSIISQIAYSES